MLIRNITSFRDLQNQKKLQAELLQMQIDNQNVLTKRVADYQNPNKPPPVPPQYKTSTEIMEDTMTQQKQVIDNLRTLGADFQTATQVSQELLQLPDGTANLVKVNKFFPTIQKDFEKRLAKKYLDAQTLMTEFLKFFSNLDSAIGVNIRDTEATTYFSKEPLIGKELLASKEEYGGLSNLLVGVFNTGLYNKREVADPIKDAVDTLFAESPTTEQLASIDSMPILERQQYNRAVEQLNKVYKLPESKSIIEIIKDLDKAFSEYDPNVEDAAKQKSKLDIEIAKLKNILNRVNEKSLRALRKFTKSFEPSEEIGRLATEKIAQPTEAQIEQIDLKEKEDYIKNYLSSIIPPILEKLTLAQPLEEEVQNIANFALKSGMRTRGDWRFNDSSSLKKKLRKIIDNYFEPYLIEQKIARQEAQKKISTLARRVIAKKQTEPIIEQKKQEKRIKEMEAEIARQEQEFARQEAEIARQAEANNIRQLKTMNQNDPIINYFDETIGNHRDTTTPIPGKLKKLFKYNNLLPNEYKLTPNSKTGDVKRTKDYIEQALATPGFGLTDKVLKHFDEDNRDLLKLKKGFNKHLKVEKEADSESSDNSSYSGKGVRNNYAFNGRRIKLGRGVSINKDMPKYREFGKYIVHYPQLIEENVLNLKFPSTGTIPSIKPVHIDDNFKEFIIDVLDWGKVNQRHYDSLTEPEKSHFLKIARGAKVLNTLKFKTPVEDKEEEDIKRLQLLFGELNAGNDNPNMIKECKVLIKKYIANGRINKNKGLEMLMELE